MNEKPGPKIRKSQVSKFSACGIRRRDFLDSLQSSSEIVGQPIPQCDETGQKYRKRQCFAATETCWCVDENGRRLSKKEAAQNEKQCETVRKKQENMAMEAAKILLETKKTANCLEEEKPGECPVLKDGYSNNRRPCECDSECPKQEKCCRTVTNKFNICLPAFNTSSLQMTPALSLVCGSNEQYSACYSACQPSCQDPSTPSCPMPNCQPGCVCLPGYIRRDGSPRSACVPRGLCQAYDLTIRCADDRRQYQTCGSACPISCETRNTPRCESERCVTGCFCKIPYILENAGDPLHSRCILPSECPANIDLNIPPTMDIAQQYLARNPAAFLKNMNSYPTSPSPLISTPNNHCSDPLKNYLNCGSKCAASCDRPLSQAASLDCALSCVAGCFCRLPYVLLDSTNPNSTCILPQLCPRKSIPPSIVPTQSQSCLDPRKEWSQCAAKQCARSCLNPVGRCSPDTCISGCICRPPYLLLHPNDSASRCVLPSECEKSCEDPTKEFISCGSSCPMGCDNRRPKNCAPCQTGCFCKNGWVFENSATWPTSKCIKLEECPAETIEETTTIIETTVIPTTTTTSTTTTLPPITKSQEAFSKEENFGIAISKNLPDSSQIPSTSQCPETTFDVGGRGCNSDMDCPIEQRCCRPMIVSLGVNPQRCVCPDKHAVWSSCGTLCPEYCGQPSVPVCSSTCNAGCHCAPGFIRARNDVGAPCVPRDSCSLVLATQKFSASFDDQPIRFATIREIRPHDPIIEDVIAVSFIHSRENQSLGKFTFSQITPNTIKIFGEINNLPRGNRYAVVMHRFGDASEKCSRVGPPFSKSSTPSFGDLDENGKLERIIDWPIGDVIGRALVIYPFSTSEWTSRAHFGEKPLGCGTIGIAKVAQ
ncbi:unnamed protein product [Caenorhabditis angaria]|uniref:Thyroglobulin type-1 domain-containing protein n=1 Tax=Caenorhabditis angaria TaxID=860376 RepID=A0A9P1N7U1_9PELO|nr:unnamed protein product [Caenorhabditis angaria]